MKFLKNIRFKHKTLTPLLIGILVVVLPATIYSYYNSKEAAAWYDGSWRYRKLITINASQVSGSTDLTDFPILINSTDSEFVNRVLSTGYDVLFTTKDGTKLDHEVEYIDSAAGTITAWVRIPSLSPTTDTQIYVYYGNPGAEDQQNAAGVWTNGFTSVLHLKEDPTQHVCDGGITYDACDSTGYNNWGDAVGGMQASARVASKIGYGYDLDGFDDKVRVPHSSTISTTASDSFTVSFWYYGYLLSDTNPQTTLAQDMMKKSAGGSSAGWRFGHTATNKLELVIADGTNSTTSTTTSDTIDEAWHYVVGVKDEVNDQIRIYFDGVLEDSDTDTTTGSLVDSGETINWGNNFNLIEDELRFSTVPRTTDWVLTEYNNQDSPSTFYSLAQQEQSKDPALYWKLDEGYGTTTQDKTNTGHITNATWALENECIEGRCLKFDGSGDYIRSGTDPSNIDFAAGESFTVQAWIKHPTISTSADTILAKYNASTGADGGYKLTMESDGDIKFGIDDDDTSFPTVAATSTAATYDDNNWHFVTGVKNADTDISLYIDGVLITSTNIGSTTGPISNTDDLFVGIDGDGSGEDWQGYIDEVKIYPYARTQAEINTDFVVGRSAAGDTAVLGRESNDFLNKGLQGYWKFDETTANTCTGGTNDSCDSSGNGYDGAWTGDAIGTPGKYYYGIEKADGGNGYVNMGDVLDFDTNNFTISIWVNLDSLSSPNTPEILDKLQTTTRGYHLRVADNDEVEFLIKGTSSNIEVNSANSAITANQWYHIVAVYDKDKGSKVYINGTQSGNTVSGDAGSIATTESLYVGTGFNGDELDGQFDELRMYDRALDEQEIARLYDWGPEPTLYYDLEDEDSTSTTYDKSRNGLNGSINEQIAVLTQGYASKIEYVEITLGDGVSTNSTSLSTITDITKSIPFPSASHTGSTGAGDDHWDDGLVDVYLSAGPAVTATRIGTGTEGPQVITVGVYVVQFISTDIKVQTGTFSIAAASTSNTATLSSAVAATANAATFFTYTSTATDDDHDDGMVAGYLSATNQMTFSRVNSAGAIAGHYYIMEALNSEFSVQRGSFAISSGASNTQTISSVTTNKSFVIASHTSSDNSHNHNNGRITVELTNSTTLTATRYGTSSTIPTIRYQVVSFAGTSELVQRGTLSYGTSDFTKTATLTTAVNTSNSIIWNTETHVGEMRLNGTGNDAPATYQRLELTSTTGVLGTRDMTASSAATGTYEVIQFEGDTYSYSAPTRIAGKVSKGLNFNGSTDYIKVADSNFLSFGSGTADSPFTISFWTNMTDATTIPFVFKGTTSPDEIEYVMETTSSDTLRIRLYDDTVANYIGVVSTETLTANEGKWVHLTATYDGSGSASGIKLYRNGIALTLTTQTGGTYTAMNNETSALSIMRNGTDGSTFGQASLDEFKMFRYAQSQKQITENENLTHPIGGSPVGSYDARWMFDETNGDTAYDKSNNGFNGDLGGSGTTCPGGGSTCPTWVQNGKINGSLSFDGGDYVSIGNITEFKTGEKTITAWIKPSGTTSSTKPIFSASGGNWYVGLAATNAMIASYNNSTPTQQTTTSANSIITPDTWQHVAYVFDIEGSNVEVRMYVNGEQRHKANFTTGYGGSYGTEFILGAYNTSSLFYSGELDDVKFYSAALNTEEIQVDMNANSSVNFGSTTKEATIALEGNEGSSPIAWWKMDENYGTSTTADSSGNGWTATMSGTMTNDDWVNTPKGSGLQLDGTDDELTVSSMTTIPTGGNPHTVEAWVNFDAIVSASVDSSIISWGTDGANTMRLLFIRNGSLARAYYANDFTSTFTMQTNKWYHIAWVFEGNGSQDRLYVNGVLVDSDTVTGVNTTGTNVYIGEYLTNSYNTEGTIADLKVYNYARTQEQVTYSYNGGQPTAWYKMDECSSTTLHDSSIWENNATLTITGSGTNDTPGTCNSGDTGDSWNNGTTGKYRSAIDLDGTDDYASIPQSDELEFGTQDFSISTWFKTSDTNSATTRLWGQVR
ncbi:MAG: DUF2341 domain-containing protein [Patescibacteria group bacterium]